MAYRSTKLGQYIQIVRRWCTALPTVPMSPTEQTEKLFRGTMYVAVGSDASYPTLPSSRKLRAVDTSPLLRLFFVAQTFPARSPSKQTQRLPIAVSECPLWVKSRHVRCTRRCPLCATSGHQLFNDVVGAGEYRRWNCEAESLGGLEIDHQFKLGR